jgi:hypothetical protein
MRATSLAEMRWQKSSDDAAVLNRHLPAGELHHFGARAPVRRMERCFLES